MQPANAIMGDSTGVDLPQMPEDDTDRKELQNKAKYSRSKEYKELKAKADARIAFYIKNLPAGYADADKQRKAEMWGFANLMIAELEMLFSENETAEQLLNELINEQILPPAS